MLHLSGKKSKAVKRLSGMELRLESLEERHLLAADLLPDISIADPYSRDAVTVAQMEARAKVEPYVASELLVALAVDSGNLPGPQRPLSAYLQAENFNARNVAALKPILSSNLNEHSTFSLVKVDLAGVDVMTAMRELDAAPNVLWTSPNFIFAGDDARDLIPNDPQYGSQYHHPLEKNNLAWDITLGSPDIVIGVTDNGVDLQHVDLASGIWVNTGETAGNSIDDDGNGYVDDVNGYNFLNNNNNPDALSGDSHGTHVSGIAAARTNNGIGVAGVAGGSTILPLKWYDGGTWTAAIIAETFAYAADNGAKIVNTSYNMDQWANNAVVHAAYQYMYDAGILHFTSAGNNNALNPPRQVFQQTLLVASTESNDSKSSFSNYGTGVDISAAGGSILSTFPNNTYSTISGTSMATPNAAGVAALIWAQNPTWTRDQVAAKLLASADNIDAQNPAFVGLLGAGRVNSFRALTEPVAAPRVKSLVGVPNGGSVPASTVITNFEVRFNQLMDSASVSNPASYDLRSPGADLVFDTADDSVTSLAITNPYFYGSNSVKVDIVGGALGIGDYRLTVKSGGVQNPFGTALDGNGDTLPGDDYRVNFSITINSFEGVGVGGGLSKLSNSNAGSLVSASELDAYPFFAEAGETVTAIVTPANPGVTLSASFVGGGSATAAAPGQAVIVPLSAVAGSGNQALQVSGNGATTYNFSIYRNVNIDGLNDSGAAVPIDNSYLSLGSGRMAAIGQATGVDEDLYTVDLTNRVGERLDVVLGSVSGQPLSQFNMELRDPTNAVVATATSSFGGAAISNYSLGIHDFLVTSVGVHTIRITASQSATYSLLVTDQLVFDTEPNDTTARSLDNVNGALGLITPSPFSRYNNSGLFVDISATGTALGLSDDAEATVTTTVGNSLLPAGSVTIANNGVVAKGAGIDVAVTNTNLPSSSFTSALVPFWDDIDADTGNVYWQERLVGGINTLIVQWHNRPHYSNVGSATFQVQLFASGPVLARYVYPDVDFGDAQFNFGASATIGVQLSSTSGATFSFNTASLANGDVIDIRSTDKNDRYSISLAAGESVQLRTKTPFDDAANLPPNALDPKLTVQDASQAVLASDSNSAGDGKNALINFTAPSNGVYFIDVSNDSGGGEYVLLATRDNPLDGDFNGDGNYDCDDIDLLSSAVIQGTDLSYDLSGDGVLDLADRDAWLLEAGLANGLGAAYLVADIDLDGTVDGNDFLVWNAFKFTPTGTYCQGDINMDGETDGLDFIEWNARKFTSVSRPVSAAPEQSVAVAKKVDPVQPDLAATFTVPVRMIEAAPPAIRTRAVERLFAAYGGERDRAPDDAAARDKQILS